MAAMSPKKTKRNFPFVLIGRFAPIAGGQTWNDPRHQSRAILGNEEGLPRSSLKGLPASFPEGNLRSGLSLVKAGLTLSVGTTERRGTSD